MVLKNMKRIFFITAIVVLLILNSNGGAQASSFDYSLYEELLDKHLHEKTPVDGFRVNLMDYRAIKSESIDPESGYSKYLRSIMNFNPDSPSAREDQIAFWINAYNIAAIKLIVDNYPVDSIRSSKISFFKNPWSKKILKVGGRKYSLAQIENDILLGKYGELTIHFGINCASLSCPPLSKNVYTGSNLKEQLKRNASKFIGDPKAGLMIDRVKGKVFVSKIFKFDKGNFNGDKSKITTFIIPYINDRETIKYLKTGSYSLDYLDYNWKLNDYRESEINSK